MDHNPGPLGHHLPYQSTAERRNSSFVDSTSASTVDDVHDDRFARKVSSANPDNYSVSTSIAKMTHSLDAQLQLVRNLQLFAIP